MNCANHPDRERVAFCQNCGKPLCAECTRTIGTAVFCEPCLAARLAAADAAASSSGTPYSSVNVPPYNPVAGTTPGAPNPVLAGVLGLIPGVGAMYNGQYAKGVVHLVVFAVLVSLADSNGVFGLFVTGWVCYQAIEAYHTARARKDGTVLPNPFGLNDIGERLGFGKSWTPVATTTVPPAPQAQDVRPDAPYTQTGSTYQGANPTQSYAVPPVQPAGSWGAPTDFPGYAVPPTPPYSDPYAAVPVDPSPGATNRFPTGAILLIGLGLLFFFGSSGIFHHFPVQRVIPFLLIAFGVWIFVRKMTNSGYGLSDDGTPAYQLRLFRALRGSIYVILVGVLFFLDSFYILSWGHSWPLFIIVAGLMSFFERSAYSSAAAAPYSYSPAGTVVPPSASSTVTNSGSEIIPTRNEEGR